MYRVQKETGWTDEYLLWMIPWVNVRMKLVDELHYVYGKSKNIEDEKELVELLGKNNGRSGRNKIQNK